MSNQFNEDRKIDLVCDEFEAAWRADLNVTIEQYLHSLPDEINPDQALMALLSLELELRSTMDQMPSLEETLPRFPHAEDIVLRTYRDAELFASDKQLPDTLGQYRIDHVIGRGTFGTVYRAFDLRLKRVVALKVLHRWYSESDGFVERFEREAQAAADLNDPNVCQVFDRGYSNGRHYYAMRYCGGENLSNIIAKEGPLSELESVKIIARLARILDSMHRRGVVHRDLKPANVLLDADKQPFITDFGLAFNAEDLRTSDPFLVAGTPAYMAPEQLSGQVTASAAQDIFSLAAMLVELLTGRPPNTFDKAEINPDLASIGSRKLREVCQKALAWDPAARHATANEFAGSLENSIRTRTRWPIAGALLTVAILVLLMGVALNTPPLAKPVTRSADSRNPSTMAALNNSEFDTRLTPQPNSVLPPKGRKPIVAKADLYERDWNSKPPPLSKWIEGRELLTVAQDGSAMYTTISAALGALKRKQVIKVLDQGPYRERLNLNKTPYDVGLISETRTRIELPDWQQQERQPDNPIFEGCVFDRSVGFRLAGFDFVAAVTPHRQSHRACIVRIKATGVKGPSLPLVIEDCRFQWQKSENWSERIKLARPERLFALQIISTFNSSPVYLQRCFLEDCVDLNVHAPVFVSQNVIRAKHSHRGLSIPPSLGQTISVTNNFIFANSAIQLGFRDAQNFYGLENKFPHPTYVLRGNYLEGEVGVSGRPSNTDAKDFRIPHVVIDRNVFHARTGVQFTSADDAEIAANEWPRSHNVYIGSQPETIPQGLPLAPTDSSHVDVKPIGPLLPDTTELRRLSERINANREPENIIGPLLGDDAQSPDWLAHLLDGLIRDN